MSSKGGRSEHKESKDCYDSKESKYDDDMGGGSEFSPDLPKINVTSIKITPDGEVDLTSPLKLKIIFELDRDVVAAYWAVQFLVDSSYRRIIKVLGETPVEDYPDGESDMVFSVDEIDVAGIPPSTLANSGLLMAVFIAGGVEVASVNMVVNVIKKDGRLVREILSPLD